MLRDKHAIQARRCKVKKFINQGYTYREIGRILGISYQQVFYDVYPEKLTSRNRKPRKPREGHDRRRRTQSMEGRQRLLKGYIRVFHDGRWQLRSHLIMEQYLGRKLEPHEFVHHINGIKTDDRTENFKLTDKYSHKTSYRDGYLQGFKDGTTARDKELEKQIRLLGWQIRELTRQLQYKLKIEGG